MIKFRRFLLISTGALELLIGLGLLGVFLTMGQKVAQGQEAEAIFLITIAVVEGIIKVIYGINSETCRIGVIVVGIITLVATFLGGGCLALVVGIIFVVSGAIDEKEKEEKEEE